ncbi:hypothetical protein NicSoilE8_05010 [Arthrobacter sp. NicSoilE8]|nr:hypothetical protein NicSoilE8_05010 [Arthrobacter sp. NicSoilE8]
MLALCAPTSPSVQAILNDPIRPGSRVVVAVASCPARGPGNITPAGERNVVLAGFFVFLDRPKANAKESFERLATLGISVKIAGGDNAKVAEKVLFRARSAFRRSPHRSGRRLSESEFAAIAREATIFAHVSPEQKKARTTTLLRQCGGAVGFMGDGVNDALALIKRTSLSPWTAPPMSPRTRPIWC